MIKKRGLILLIPILTLIISAMTSSLVALKIDSIGGQILIISSAVSAIALLIIFFVIYRNLLKYLLKTGQDIKITEQESLYFFPAPTIIIDKDNVIVWNNKSFEENILTEGDAYGIKLTDMIDFHTEDLYTQKGAVVKRGDKFYRLLGNKPNVDGINLSMVYFKDITKLVNLEKEYKLAHPYVILIMIDNYEDLLQNSKESDKARVFVEVEKLFEAFIDSTTGVIRKLSNDKFIIIVEQRHLDTILKERFSILDKARSIMVSDRMGVTLSIGVGYEGKTLSESEASAKQALDMALGRGGDQAAIKTESGFEFFGGISKGIEKHAKVKTRIIANAIMELVDTHDSVFVMGHRFGDLDSIGSAVGLCTVMRKKGKKSYVIVDPEKNLSKVLIDYIRQNEQSDIFISPNDVLHMVDDKTLLVIVDTHNPEFVDSKEVYEKAKNVVVIDHHRKMVNHIDNAVLFYHEPYASSASEMVSELIQYFGEFGKISAPSAEALLAGITLDTKNFVMRTGVRTFEAAAFLKKHGADTVMVKNLFASSIETYQLKSIIVAGAEIHHECAISCSDSTSSDMRIAAPQAADELLGISGVKASFVIYSANDRVNISARSMGAMNVQLIMEDLGGGGHMTMAAAQLENVTLDEAKARLVESISNFVKNRR